MQSASPSGIQNGEAESDYTLFDLGPLTRLLWRHRFFVLGSSVAGALIAIAAAFVVHPLYQASVRLMPPAPKQTSLSILMPSRTSGDLNLGLMSSRTVADDVIEHQHLADYFHTAKPSQLRALLEGMAKVTVDKDQFVSVTVQAKEPETALRIANEYPQALYRLNHSVALAEAAHRWEYFEGPLNQEKDKLAEAEDRLKEVQQKTGIVLPQAQVQLGLTAIAELKQQIVGRQAQLAALETGSTGQNAQVVELKSQIGSLSGQLARLEAQTAGSNAKGGQLPELTLEVARREREVKYHTALFEIISKQYENARIDESYSPPVELVDSAVLPDEKVWPSRKLFAIVGLLLGLLLGVAVVVIRAVQPVRRFLAFVHAEPAGSTDAATR